MKKQKLLMILMAGMFISLFTNAQETEKELAWYEKGKVSGKVFANFHTMAVDEFGEHSAFEVKRAYFGYTQNIDDNFSAKLLLDIGDDEEFGKRTAFFKNAYVQYKNGKLKVQTGIAGNFQFKTQEKFFGYRYVVKSFQDMYKFGPSADLGVFAYYKASDAVTINLSINNGEGYGKVQDDASNNFKTALGATITPGDVLTLSLYADSKSFSDSSQMTISAFVGANIDPLSLGVEFVNQTNHDLEEDKDYMGISAIAKVKATSKVKVFARYDMVSSAELDDGTGTNTKAAWNSKDGSYLVGGVEYIANKSVKFAFDYQHQMFDKKGSDDKGYLFLHMEAKF